MANPVLHLAEYFKLINIIPSYLGIVLNNNKLNVTFNSL